ncbi:MAG: hypothetical protein JWN72_1341 [Thermoleophilia bacterium]|nr:hypothetical protein [Thermoleophilia bacterium]
MPAPLLTVIVPTKDRPDLLRRALESIAAQQFSGTIQTIVVDDGSALPQQWVTALPGLDLTYVRHEASRDLAGARNTGLRHATGTYVGYLDDDDVWLPQHAQLLVDALEAHPTARAAYSLAERWHQQLQQGTWVTVEAGVEHRHAQFDLDMVLLTNLTPVNTVVHERSLIDEVGGFDETLAVVEDWDLWIRLRARTEFVHVPEVTCAYTTRGATNMTQQRIREFWPAQARIFHRYRELAAEFSGLGDVQQSHLAKVIATMGPDDAAVAQERARIALGQPPSDASLHHDYGSPGRSGEPSAGADASTDTAGGVHARAGEEPLVSILIPTCDEVDLLRAAVESASNQTYANVEILISDDCSTDATRDLIDEASQADPRIRGWVNAAPVGRTENYRVLLRAARGEFVKYLDADDLLHADCVERLLAPLLRDERLVLATSKRQLIDLAGDALPDHAYSQAIAPSPRRMPGADLVNLCLRTLANWIGEPSAPLFRRAAVAATTMFEFGGRPFDASADLALWSSLLSRGDAWYEPDPLSSQRVHDAGDETSPAVVVEALTDLLAIIELGPQYGFLLESDDARLALTGLLGRVAATYGTLHADPAAAALLPATTRIAELLAATRADAREPDMPFYTTTVVVPVTDDLGAAIENITAISDGTPGTWFEVCFVDDAADPELANLLDNLEGDIQVVRHESRLGASASYASGIEHARGEHVVLLHPQAVVHPGWLPPLVGLLQAGHDVDAVLPLLRDAEAPDIRDVGSDDAVLAVAATRDLLHDTITRSPVTTIGDSAGHALHIARDALVAAGARVVVEPASRVEPLPTAYAPAPSTSVDAAISSRS